MTGGQTAVALLGATALLLAFSTAVVLTVRAELAARGTRFDARAILRAIRQALTHGRR